MAYNIQWYVDQQVLLSRYWGEQTEEDVIESIKQLSEMVRSSHFDRIHVINDVSGLEKPLPFLKMLNIMRRAELPEHSGWLITVGEKNPIVKLVVGGVASISGQRMRSIKTLDEAIAYLKEIDHEIEWGKVKE